MKGIKLKHERRGTYKVAGPDCEKCYIGETERLVLAYWGKHESEAETAIAIARHIIEERHSFTWDNVEVIKECGNNSK